MGFKRSVLAVGIFLLAAGCSVTSEVYGVVGEENDIFNGKATGYQDGSGRIELHNASGTRCIGQFAYSTAKAGQGMLSCNDGQRAVIQFTSLTMTSGYGFGTSSTGRPVKFFYGMTPQMGAKYIGMRSEQIVTAAAPPGTPGGQAPSSPGAPPSTPGATPSTPGAAPTPPQAAARTRSSGTGFYISRQGHLLTNAHVVERCKDVSVTSIGGSAVSATVASLDRSNDLAVLQASTAPQAIAQLRGRAVRQGDSVVAYGFPLAGSLSSGGVLTSGNVNALTGLRDDTRYLQVSAPVQPGNSGGPLLDTSGAVAGVVTSGLRRGNAQNVNFALKTDVVRTFLAAVGVNAETSGGGRELSMPDIGERARAFTVFVECKG